MINFRACTAPLEHSPSPSPHLACNYRGASELRYAWLTFPSLHAAFSSYSAFFASVNKVFLEKQLSSGQKTKRDLCRGKTSREVRASGAGSEIPEKNQPRDYMSLLLLLHVMKCSVLHLLHDQPARCASSPSVPHLGLHRPRHRWLVFANQRI